MSTLMNPRAMRERHVVEIDMGQGQHVLARREDMTVMVFEGRIPMPLLVAVQKMIEMPGASPTERLAALGEAHSRELVDVVREHAIKVVLQPVLVLEDDGNPDHLPVGLLTLTQLIHIWSETAVVPLMTAQTAADFRAGARTPDAPVLPDGEAVQPAAKPVVVPIRPDIDEFVRL
jgi:hypothetical protein